MTLPSTKVTVEGVGVKGVAEAAGADLLALVFLPEGSPVGGLVVGRRILLAVLFIACVSNGFGLKSVSLGFAPLAMKWFTSNGSEAGFGVYPLVKGKERVPQIVLTGLKLL